MDRFWEKLQTEGLIRDLVMQTANTRRAERSSGTALIEFVRSYEMAFVTKRYVKMQEWCSTACVIHAIGGC